jgi:hypothetical protein
VASVSNRHKNDGEVNAMRCMNVVIQRYMRKRKRRRSIVVAVVVAARCSGGIAALLLLLRSRHRCITALLGTRTRRREATWRWTLSPAGLLDRSCCTALLLLRRR